MNVYERLLQDAQNIIVDDSAVLPKETEGFYVEVAAEKLILINKNVKCIRKKRCILAEEMGHYHTTSGIITDQSKMSNRKQELKSRRWGIKRLIQIEDLIESFDVGVRNKHELAEHLEVTEEFLDMTLDHFGKVYGYMHTIEKYTILFNPLCIYKNLE